MDCPHGEPHPSCCIECLESPPAPAPRPRLAIERTLIARYRGECVGCALPIHEGQSIALMTDETYRHAWCAP